MARPEPGVAGATSDADRDVHLYRGASAFLAALFAFAAGVIHLLGYTPVALACCGVAVAWGVAAAYTPLAQVLLGWAIDDRGR